MELVPIHHCHHQQVTQHPIATVHLGPKPTFIINDLKLAKVREWTGRQSLKRLNYSTKKSGKSGDKEHTGAVWSRRGEREDGQRGSDQTSVLQPEAPGFAFGLEMISLNVVYQGIIWTSGTQWSTQRRFSLKTLKDFGFGKDRIEDSIHFEVSEDLTFKPTLEKWRRKKHKVLLVGIINLWSPGGFTHWQVFVFAWRGLPSVQWLQRAHHQHPLAGQHRIQDMSQYWHQYIH